MKRQYNSYKKQTAIVLMRTMLIFTAFAGWSGLLYPDLTFESGVVRVYNADGKEKSGLTGRELFEELLRAEPERIRLKSRLAEIFFYFIS